MLLERAERAGRADREDARDGHGASGRGLAAADQRAARWTPISASSPRARAIRCAMWARSSRRRIRCPRWATTCRANQAQIDIQFLPDLEGYIWVFPRCGHLSVGICGKGEPAALLRKRLEAYMAGRGISWKGAAFYSHLLPSLDTKSWKENRVAGDGWMAVGDAAGLVDPITGEGPVLRDPLGRPGGAEPAGRRGWSGGEHAAISHAAAARFRRGPGVRVAPGQAGVPGAFPVRLGAAAHGAVHAPQSRALPM